MVLEPARQEAFNVAVVTSPLTPQNKSIETCLQNMLSIIEPSYKQIFLITGNFQNNSQSFKIHVKSIRHDMANNSKIISILRYVLMQFKLARILFAIRKENISDAIFYIGSTLTIPLLAAKLLKKKTIVVATGSVSKSMESSFGRHNYLKRLFFILIERVNFSLTDRIAVESQSVVGFLGLERYKNKVVIGFSRYVDTSLFNIRKSVSNRENAVIYAGRISREKGALNFLEAIPKVLKKSGDARFLFVGDGPLTRDITKKLEAYGLSRKVRFEGWVHNHKLPDYLNEAKLLVLPSYSEGLPGILQEAMACGTIVLATSVGGIPDLIKDDVTGFLLENNSPDCIAHGILRVLNHRRLDVISDNARKLIENTYSYDNAARSLKHIRDFL